MRIVIILRAQKTISPLCYLMLTFCISFLFSNLGPSPHYAVVIWKRFFTLKMHGMFNFSSTLRQRNFKTLFLLCKRANIFVCNTLGRKILKRNNRQSFYNCVWENPWKKHHMNMKYARHGVMFSVHIRTQNRVFKFFRSGKDFRLKSPFSLTY